MKLLIVSLVLAGAAAFMPSLAIAQSNALIVQDAWIRKPPGVNTAAAYFVLQNTGSLPLKVIGVSSPIADHVMVHETSVVQGQSRMRMRDEVVVAPGKTVTFAPE